jgi:CRP-like cAMP-binding protein
LKYFEVIKDNPLFKGIKSNDLESMLKCLSVKYYSYQKNSFIILVGQKIPFVGIVLSGKLAIINEDRNGNENIINKLGIGEMFGEAFACAGLEKSTVSVQVIENSEVMLLDYKKIITSCTSACEFHTKLIDNMLAILAKKVLILNQKVEIISKRTTREKILAFLETQRDKASSNKFAIPYSREQLAKFLFVDRSSMSRELCKMRDDGLIKFNKNRFELMK